MTVPAIRTARLHLVSMSASFIEAVLAGHTAEAEAAGDFTLSCDWPDEHDARFLRLRLEQMQRDPRTQQWLVRAMVLPTAERPMIGHIGFHGPPEVIGRAELGYTVMPAFRRRGYAVEAAEAMMEWARTAHQVERFFVSISPDNGPSLAMAAKMGFTQVGEQMDDEDGLEYVFELARR